MGCHSELDPRLADCQAAGDLLREQLALAYGTLLEVAETEALVHGIPADGSWRFDVWVDEWEEHFVRTTRLMGQWRPTRFATQPESKET